MSKDLDTILTDPKTIAKMAALTKKLNASGKNEVSVSLDSPTDHIEIMADGSVIMTPRAGDAS